MCGFAGSFGTLDLGEGPLTAMGEAVAHRGPDDHRQLVRPGEFSVIFHRLAILDLENGSQPLLNEQQSVIVVCNGEIYNSRELRHYLQQRGHTFRSRSDCEVLPHLYEEYGETFVKKLNGMFALALWDSHNQIGILARDRLGVKPLYFASQRGGIVFGSEPRTILASGLVQATPDPQALVDYMSLQYVPAPRTGFVGIEKLRPGEMLTWSRAGTSQQAYWSLGGATGPPRIDDPEDGLELLDELLLDATRRRLVSDVPVGLFLSGGIDSSLVASYVAEAGSMLEMFTIGFEDPRYDESRLAHQVASALGANLTTATVTPEFVPRVAELVPVVGEPFADSSIVPTYAVSALARRKVTVALAGDGGDEAFGGYDRYRRLELHRAVRLAGLTAAVSRVGAAVARRGPLARSGDRLSLLSLDERDRFAAMVSHFTPTQLDALLTPDFREQVEYSGWNSLARVPASGSAQRFLDLDTTTYLPGAILTKVDRASMAVGLEVRAPFLDFRVHELASSFPLACKVSRSETKPLLRALAMRRGLPPSVAQRPKRGFSMPLGAWLRGPLRDWTLEILLDPITLDRGYFRVDGVRRLIDLHMSGATDHTARIWNMLMLELWHRELIARPPSPSTSRATPVAA